MKIKRVTNHGIVRWRVNDTVGAKGKRQRKFFETKEEAENFVQLRKDDKRTFGNHFNTIPPDERIIIAYQINRLRKLGWDSLTEVVDFIERQGKRPQSISLGIVADEFLAAKKIAGLRPRYLQTLKASIKRFLINRREKRISEISAAEIQEYISCNGWANSTMRSYLVDVRTLFSFAVKRKYLTENPAMAVDLPRMDEKSPGILSVTQVEKLLSACLDNQPDNLAVFVLCLFAGIRRQEAEKIQWSEIGDEFIEVKAEKAKTRRRRLVEISPQVRAWLDCAKKIGAKLPAVNYADKLKRTLEKAELRTNWPQNALRHSFASYHFANFRNENQTATMMGNSPQMIFQHYRQLVRPADAEKFFNLMPPLDAGVRANDARGKIRKMPPRAGKITAEKMAAIFDHGRLTLSRQDAVAALCKNSGCKKVSAYLALSTGGRFDAQLKEIDGFLRWQPLPLVPEIKIPTENSENSIIPFPIISEPEKIPALNH